MADVIALTIFIVWLVGSGLVFPKAFKECVDLGEGPIDIGIETVMSAFAALLWPLWIPVAALGYGLKRFLS